MKLKSDNSKFLSLGLHFMIGEQGTDLPSSKKKKKSYTWFGEIMPVFLKDQSCIQNIPIICH